MEFFERRDDCGPVEKFIWDRVGRDYGDFAGIKRLGREQLFELRGLVEAEINKVDAT